MLKTLPTYHPKLRSNARNLRQNMTNAEQHLWYHLRCKPLLNIPYYRQKPMGRYIVDFYAPTVKLIIEIEGSQYFEGKQRIYDEERTVFLEQQEFKVLRFNNLDVLKSIQQVIEIILFVMRQRLK